MMMQTKTIRKAVKQNLQKVFRNLWEILRNDTLVLEKYLKDKIVLASAAQIIQQIIFLKQIGYNLSAPDAERIRIGI
jgi:hypothetical protein